MRTPADEQSVRLDGAVPSPLRTDVVRTVQRLAGNRAALVALSVIQREEPAQAPATSDVATDGPGRVPRNRSEQGEWDDAFPDSDTARYRILVEPASHPYNCFAWAVGVTTMEITFNTLKAAGYGPDLDGWTKYLDERHGFGRFADGLHSSADIILYGGSPIQVLHAARRAEVPYGDLTFTSKLGGRNFSPVILHAPADLEGGGYGHALRSFWLGPADQAAPRAAPSTTPEQPPQQ